MNATMMNVSTSLLFSLMNSTKYVIDNSSTGVIDINECETNNHTCSPHAVCENTAGGYNCSYPSPVNDLLIHNVTSCSFFATWSSKFLLNYTVKLLTSEQEVLSFDTDKQEWLVTGLKPGALYVLRVVSKVCALEGQVTESTVRTALTSEFATVSHTRQTATSASTAAFSQRSTTSTISPEIQKTSPLSVTCMSQNISVAVTKAFLNQKAISESSLYLGIPQCNVSSSNDTHVMLTTAKGICGTNTTYNCGLRATRSSEGGTMKSKSSEPLYRAVHETGDPLSATESTVAFIILGVLLSVFLLAMISVFLCQCRKRIGHYNFNMKPGEKNFNFHAFAE
ncbi:UROL1 protein, partial [Polypterus senegalus]|nr:UROL1 protein [Polypterus senegalus]